MPTPKVLLKKPGTKSAILAIALLVAIIASMNSVVNYVSAQSEALASLVQAGETYIILNRNATAPTNSQINMETARRLSENTEINMAFPQKLLEAQLKTDVANLTVAVRAVENVENYLKFYAARLNGTYAKNGPEMNIGEVLARLAGVTVNATITLTFDGRNISFSVAGIYRARAPLDAEIIIPLTAIGRLAAEDDEVSIIEFTFKHGVDGAKALTRLAEGLPPSVKIIKVQQPSAFMRAINLQTLTFLNAWSLAVYAVIAAASYIITTRLIAESSYELVMLRALGASERRIFALIVVYIAIIAVLGSVLGIALGVVGAQVASKILSWLHLTVEIAPFLRVEEALKVLLLTLSSSILGCLYPAHKSTPVRVRGAS
ncbi:MAG: ABC transporter permease [Candidatus Bathyarchaeota archaeon]|nr:ABC transporter permease [Candidatus Bathyarchaeota archaeon]